MLFIASINIVFFIRFADILGLDLSEVKTFIDEVPKIPKAAYADLDVSLSDIEVASPKVTRKLFPSVPLPQKLPAHNTISLVPMFNQPGATSQFQDTIIRQKICLENAFMEGPKLVYGVVRVQNISFHKSVVVRWTANNWLKVQETDAEYVVGSSQGNTDKFSFKLSLPDMDVGDKLQFCLRYECGGEYWDSNGGSNYIFQVGFKIVIVKMLKYFVCTVIMQTSGFALTNTFQNDYPIS